MIKKTMIMSTKMISLVYWVIFLGFSLNRIE